MSDALNLPVHDDAEAAVLSACLMTTTAFDEAAAIIGEQHFHSGRHAALWRAMRECRADGVAIEPYGVEEQLKRAGELTLAGGRDYIGYLLDMVPTAANIGYHAGLVREYHNRRELIRVGESLAASAREGRETAQQLAASVSSSLVEVAAKSVTGGFRHIKTAVWDVCKTIEDRAAGRVPPGVATGYPEIDEAIGGLRGGDLMICAGVPGSGKTALGLNILLNAAGAGTECAMVSAEMTMNGLTERCISNLALIDSRSLRMGRLDDTEWPLVAQASGYLAKIPLYIDDTPTPSIEAITARTRYLKAKHPGLRLVVVDFIQLVRAPGDDQMALALTRISYDLKGLAKELDLAVIATCQVDAASVEKQENPRPQLRHLRWSQGMREAGDFVALVHRPEQLGHSLIEVEFGKARDLPPFTAVLGWNGKYMRVESRNLPREQKRAA